MKNIYIILTKSNSLISSVIWLITREPYTHASISFDDGLGSMYSFARYYSRLPIPAGMTEENIRSGFYKNRGKMPCAVLCLSVSEAEYFAAKGMVMDMLCRKRELSYSLRGLFFCSLGVRYESPQRYFCSQFVSKVLSDSCGVILPKPACLMHPADLLRIPRLRKVFTGILEDVRSHESASAVRNAIELGLFGRKAV